MFVFDNTYARLPARFFARVAPTPVRDPEIVHVNTALAQLLGVSVAQLSSREGASVLSGNTVPTGAEPIALAYAGHQFGGFVPQLGDGRAILLGEVVGTDGQRRDIQLKGSGPTPFSRGGDGRAGLGPVMREYIVSEAMAALGVPTTRALAVVVTGEPVYRERALPGAVLTRVAASHIRVGTFEYFAARRDVDGLRVLTDHALGRHYPHAVGEANGALALLENVIQAQAHLVAQWMGLGFVHGVMNTDNTTISGETIDFGPCAFLDEYNPNKWFSSIDRSGRYAFSNQPQVAQWNLARLAETLLDLISDKEDEAVALAMERLQTFPAFYDAAVLRLWRSKLGLVSEEPDDALLMRDLLERMAANHVDYTLFFRRLCDSAADPRADEAAAALFDTPGAFMHWAEAWRHRLAAERTSPAERAAAMRKANPAFIPRNHRVEEALEAAMSRGDLAPFETLVRVLAKPYEDQPDAAHLAEPPGAEQHGYKTFCGT